MRTFDSGPVTFAVAHYGFIWRPAFWRRAVADDRAAGAPGRIQAPARLTCGCPGRRGRRTRHRRPGVLSGPARAGDLDRQGEDRSRAGAGWRPGVTSVM